MLLIFALISAFMIALTGALINALIILLTNALINLLEDEVISQLSTETKEYTLGDYYIDYMEDSPWIHMPFEKYETTNIKDFKFE